MKSPSNKRESIFKQDSEEQTVRVIKAAQAGKLLHAPTNGDRAVPGVPDLAHKPEIRLIHSGADFCDLEVICGCGESTQVRCWNTPPTEEKSAV